MAILIDPPRWPAHGRRWSHLVSDTAYEELHAFAAANGIPARGFEGDHYDVPEERYAALVAAGARPVEGRVLVRALLASGLRFPKRKGEWPLARYHDALPGETAHLLDVVLSPLDTPGELTAAAAVFVFDAATSLVLVHTPSRMAWGAPAGGRERGESVRAGAVREVWEECGLTLDPASLVPCGYERVTFDAPPRPPSRWPHRRNFVAVFMATVPGVEPDLQPQLADVDAAEWVSATEAERWCSDQFWWPLLARVLAGRPDR